MTESTRPRTVASGSGPDVTYPAPPPDAPGATVAAAMRWGWHVFKVNAKPMIISSIVIVLIAAVLNVASQFFNYFGQHHHRDFWWFMIAAGVLSVINNLFSLFIQVGVIRITVRDLAQDRVIEQSSLFTTERYWAFVGAAVIATVGTAIGLVLFIVPGIIWFTYTIFFGWFVIDQKMGPWQAVVASMKLVQSRVGLCFLFIFAFFGVYLLGALALLVGLIVAAPVTQFALAYLYKYLQGDPILYEPLPPPTRTRT